MSSLTALTDPGSLLFDTAYPRRAAARLYAAPQATLVARTLGEVESAVEAAEAALRDGLHVAGVLTYEAGAAFVDVPEAAALVREAEAAGPLVWLGCYERAETIAPENLERELEAAARAVGEITAPTLALPRAEYTDRIDAVRALIREGEVYQINFTLPLDFGYDGDPLALYAALRARQPVGYGALLNLPHRYVLSLSPELFFEQTGDRITARPMKGTAPRGATVAEDAEARRSLRADEKSRAENLMIVDLLRNDLAQVCAPGSVRVPDLFTVEPYATLLQMTSSVEGRLAEGAGFAGLMRALFPCGSVTGAPKRRAMRHIAALEGRPRGAYCGAIGFAEPTRRAVFSVAIRTLALRSDAASGTMGVGSGIVWDSDASDEYDECILKARFLTDLAESGKEGGDEGKTGSLRAQAQREGISAPLPGTRLIETMRWDSAGVIPLLDLHLARLARSAEALGFRCDLAAVRARIEEATASLPALLHRVRLLLGASGACEISATPLDLETSAAPLRVGFASERADASDWRLYHKTSERGLYERAYAEAQARGWDEAILLNARGEVTEGSRTNLFARRGAALLTPPLACGLLGGVHRAHLLATRTDIREARLTPDDLRRADALYLSNAVWGLREAVLVDSDVNLE